jgi:hypothetical protein
VKKRLRKRKMALCHHGKDVVGCDAGTDLATTTCGSLKRR